MDLKPLAHFHYQFVFNDRAEMYSTGLILSVIDEVNTETSFTEPQIPRRVHVSLLIKPFQFHHSFVYLIISCMVLSTKASKAENQFSSKHLFVICNELAHNTLTPVPSPTQASETEPLRSLKMYWEKKKSNEKFVHKEHIKTKIQSCFRTHKQLINETST